MTTEPQDQRPPRFKRRPFTFLGYGPRYTPPPEPIEMWSDWNQAQPTLAPLPPPVRLPQEGAR